MDLTKNCRVKFHPAESVPMAAYLGSSPAERDLLNVTAQFFRGWTASDPQAAARSAWRPRRSSAICRRIGRIRGCYAARDPAGAADFLLSSANPRDPEFTIAAQRIGEQLLQHGDSAAAKKWFEQLPTDDAGVSPRKTVIGRNRRPTDERGSSHAAKTFVGDRPTNPGETGSPLTRSATRSAAENPSSRDVTGFPRSRPTRTMVPSRAWGLSSETGSPAIRRDWSNGCKANQPSGSRAFAQAAGECAVLSAQTDYNRALEWLNQIPSHLPQCPPKLPTPGRSVRAKRGQSEQLTAPTVMEYRGESTEGRVQL